MIRLAALGILLVGCGRLGFDDQPGVMPADARHDAPDASPPTGPFGTPAPVADINTTSAEDDPSLTADGLELYFNSNRPGGTGGNDMWVATRAAIGDPWGTPRAISELNTTGDDATPVVSHDGLTLYWAAPGAGGAKDLYVATRPDRASSWSGKQRIVELASAADEAGPAITRDALALYFARDPSGTDDIYVATRAAVGDSWGAPAAVVELNAAGVLDSEPSVNDTDTFVIWYSARSGNNDLWSARRASPAQPWGTATPLAELNTAAAESDPWLSPDERVLYFARDNDLFVATR